MTLSKSRVSIQLCHKIRHSNSTKNSLDISLPGGRQDTKYTDMQSRSYTEERKEPSHWERSTIRYTQHEDTRDTTSDRERWRVTQEEERNKGERESERESARERGDGLRDEREIEIKGVEVQKTVTVRKTDYKRYRKQRELLDHPDLL